MHTLYDYPHSGNCYKIKLLFHQLGLPLATVPVDILAGDTHSDDFRRLSAFEMAPVLVGPDGAAYAESNAILWRFAAGTALAPDGPEAEYDALRWMFFEQNVLEPNIGRARRLLHSEGLTPEEAGPQLAERQAVAAAGLARLDRAIGERRFLVGGRYGIADIAVFGYVHVAPEGGVSLDGHANVARWLDAVRATPDFVPL